LKKKNGMVTLFVLWLGGLVVVLTCITAGMSTLYLRQACRYRDSIEAMYLAESALLVGWHDLSQRSFEDMPTHDRIAIELPQDMAGAGRKCELAYYMQKQTPPYKGSLIAIGSVEATQVSRTCSIMYQVVLDNLTHESEITVLSMSN